MTTIYEIAAQAGVSPNTVSRVLNGKQKGNYPKVAAKARRIVEISERLNYRPNGAARAMQSKFTRQIGVLLRNEAAPHFRSINQPAFEMVVGINERMRQKGYVVSLIHIGDVRGDVWADLGGESRVFDEHLLDGMIVVGNTPKALAREIVSRMPQTVWLDSDVWGKQRCIRRDERHAGRLAARMLIDAGFPRLSWWAANASPNEVHYSSMERFRGAELEARSAGIPIDSYPDLPWIRPDVAQVSLEKNLREQTGILASDNLTARWVFSAAADMGKNPGRDFGMACCDDTAEMEVTWPQLSRVEFDRFALGQLAAEMLLKVLADPEARQPSQRVAGTSIPGTTAKPFIPEAMKCGTGKSGTGILSLCKPENIET